MNKEEQICELHTDAVKKAVDAMPNDDLISGMADLFKVFGDGTRMKIITALQSGELCVCDLAEILGASVSAVSHQLRILRQSKLVRTRRDGREIYYLLDDDHIDSIISLAKDHLSE